jgi:ankyrin repeat protein
MEPLDSLVMAAQKGDTEAFNRIVERFQDMACASAYAMIEDMHLAEDVAQKDELIDVMRDTLQEQRSSITDTFPAKVRLLIAARSGDIDTVKELLARSPILLNMKMEHGETKGQRAPPVVPGITALHEAAMNDHTQLAQLLFNYGADSNTRTSYGLTPLHGAVLYHCYETAAVLLTHGANAELPLSSGLTALHLAAMKGDIEMVRLLLAHGATIDCRSRYARTPLHWAALKGHAEVVHLLLAYGADHDARDATGRTPRNWAIARENTMIVMLLSRKDTLIP